MLVGFGPSFVTLVLKVTLLKLLHIFSILHGQFTTYWPWGSRFLQPIHYDDSLPWNLPFSHYWHSTKYRIIYTAPKPRYNKSKVRDILDLDPTAGDLRTSGTSPCMCKSGTFSLRNITNWLPTVYFLSLNILSRNTCNLILQKKGQRFTAIKGTDNIAPFIYWSPAFW